MALPRSVDLLNRTISRAGLRVTSGIAYGPEGRHLLDVYRPAKSRAALPVIVFFYGGSWQTGERADYRFAAASLARRGYVVVVPDYRLYPAKYPAFLQDGAAAIAWVVKHVGEHGGDAEHIFLLGHSAGAYNAVMLALVPAFLQEQGVAPARLAGVIGLSGPYDFLPLRDPVLREIFSAPEEIRHTQPITQAHGAAPPMFLLTGGADKRVLPRNTALLAARLRALGGVVETKVYPKLGHIGIILAMAPYFRWLAPVLHDVTAFCEACRAGDLSADRSGISFNMVG